MLPLDFRPFLLGKAVRNLLHRPHKADFLPRQQYRGFQPGEQFKPSGHALLGTQSQSVVFLGQVLILRKIPSVWMVLFADNVLL